MLLQDGINAAALPLAEGAAGVRIGPGFRAVVPDDGGAGAAYTFRDDFKGLPTRSTCGGLPEGRRPPFYQGKISALDIHKVFPIGSAHGRHRDELLKRECTNP